MPNRLTAVDAARRIAAGDLTSEALVRACLARIAARDAEVKAWCWIDPAQAIAAAREADTRRLLDAGKLGPLHGVPVGIKDIIDTADMPTQHNSRIFRGHRPARDAACVTILRAAGAVILGKTETVEFASHGRNPVTVNPHDFARTPGGSSSGSAAAVAADMVPLSFGTQTGGSIIRPGAFCGVYGFKPTHGLVSSEGAKPFSPTLDTIGWYARSAADLRLLADVFEVADGTTAPAPAAGSLRIGICRTEYWSRAEPGMRDAMATAERRLRAAGAQVEDVALGPALAALNDLKETVMRVEGRVAFLDLERARPDLLSPGIVKRMADARQRGHGALRDALDRAAVARIEFDRLAGAFDALLTPAANGEAPLGLTFTGDPIFNGLWTLLHAPCVTVPGLVGPAGLPIGLQLVAPRYRDARLLAVAETLGALLAGADATR
ncbi:MAG: amidase [Alphaproteobacteria bacterium]|nr:amidase [Alphaproteobacteria bacterium]